MDEQQRIDMETKLAHHEMTIETLQEVVYEQQKMIEKISSRLDRLAEKVVGHNAELEIGPANEKPPHY